jgi:YidC/Oxa1 family membrane protein insertase
MNQIRTFLIIAWAMLAFLLWQAWQTDHAVPAPTTIGASSTASQAANDGVPLPPSPAPGTGANVAAVPGVPAIPGAAPVATSTASVPAAPPVTISNDLLRLQVDPRGASIVGAELLAYAQTEGLGSPPVKLLDADPAHYFVAESGLLSQGGAAPNHEAPYQLDAATGATTARAFTLPKGTNQIEVPFVWSDPSGISVRKTYVLTRGSYVITVKEEIHNGSSAPWVGYDYRQLQRVPPVIAKNGGMTNPESYSFAGAAWYSPQDKFEKRKFAKFDESLDKPAVTGGWIAMLQHHFLAAWIPSPQSPSRFSIATVNAGGTPHYVIREIGPALQVAAGASGNTETRLYIGPKLQEILPSVAPGFGLTVDYGMFTLIAGPLYWLLAKLHWLLGNWGWAIVALVVLLKIALFKLSEAQYRNMAKMRALQPRLEALKQRYGEDKQQYNMAMMDLYKKEKVNPAGGCLPMLIPIPIFLALYWVLIESVELRHAPWIGWIHSLTDKDPYFILPALNMLIMFTTQRLSPTPGMDPMQKRMMQIMPLAFGIMFAFFPAGLVLYYVCNGGLGLLQQWWLLRKHGGGLVKPAKTA